MNKQSNIYTIIYIVVLVVVVGAALAFTALSLKEKQQANADNDKRRQILSSINVTASDAADISSLFESHVTSQVVINSEGDSIGRDAFSINIASEIKKPGDERQLPLYICNVDGNTKYVIPLYGAGLWGPIWGYISLNDDASTVYGAVFVHQGETPGLGAEITKPAFSDQFTGKQLFKGLEFLPIAVVKTGQAPAGNEDYVNGISGGTITSKGVGSMLDSCLKPYRTYLQKIRISHGR